jgi:dihydroxyacetone kinase-like protein
MVSAIVGDLPGRGEALLLVNGFGGTPAMELYLTHHAALGRLEKAGLKVSRSLVDETRRLWDAPVHTAALRWRM